MMALSLAAIIPATCDATLGRARFSWDPVPDPNVTGYKIHWGTQTGVYTHSQDAGNQTNAIIAEFTEGVEYFTAISAYSATGEESDYSSETSFVYDSSDRLVLLEAEDGALTPPMQVSGDGSVSWVSASPADPAAATSLSFSVPYSRQFYVWCRVLAPSATADSFFVSVDDGAEYVYDVYGEESPAVDAFPVDWTWSRIEISPGTARAHALTSGTHSIRFRCRENALLDRVVIVSNSNFIPSDALPRSGDFVAVVTQPQDTNVTDGGSLTLSATFLSTRGPLSYHWTRNGNPVPDANLPSLSLSNMTGADGGIYTITASFDTASATTSPVTLSVISPGVTADFKIRQMSIANGNQMTFEIDGALGTELGIYASSDLVNWNLISTQANTGTSFTVSDPDAVGATRRFYRIADVGRP